MVGTKMILKEDQLLSEELLLQIKGDYEKKVREDHYLKTLKKQLSSYDYTYI
jgi:hypothetical protein